SIRIQRRQGRRWRTVRVLRQDGRTGRNRLRFKRPRGRSRKPQRALLNAVDAVGNRARPARLKLRR
ncbi:MAG TPA: hypothetical protein VER75_06545, partial [Thermoleophilaceae bacterium]|nr:hypothetical protein [Thermoleophilaceae bacterium]